MLTGFYDVSRIITLRTSQYEGARFHANISSGTHKGRYEVIYCGIIFGHYFKSVFAIAGI